MTMPGAITAADIMHELSALRGDVAGLRGELGSVNVRLAVIDVQTKTASSEVTDHEARLRGLEQFRNKLLGVAIMAGLGSGLASGLIGYILGHLHL